MTINYLALKAAILARDDCQSLSVTNDMPKQNAAAKDQAIADIFNASTGERVVERYLTALGLMSALGTETGATILIKLDTLQAQVPALKWIMRKLDSDQGINLGDPETFTTIDKWVSNAVLAQTEGDAIKALAIQPSSIAHETVGRPITGSDVSIALRNY